MVSPETGPPKLRNCETAKPVRGTDNDPSPKEDLGLNGADWAFSGKLHPQMEEASVVSTLKCRNITLQFFVPVTSQLGAHSWATRLKLRSNRREKGQVRCDISALTRH